LKGTARHHHTDSTPKYAPRLPTSFRERWIMTEQEIEHVAKAIYLVRVAPRRFPRKWDELTVEARRSFEKDAIAAIKALDELRGPK
jgi:hypothetical protein